MYIFNELFCVLAVLAFPCHGLLNIEELTDTKYALDIWNEPLNALEINSVEGLKLASRHGQDYYCKLPKDSNKNSENHEDKIPKSTPVSLLLEPMRKEACLKTVKDWWTYEFCFGKYIKQYHSEGDVPQGDITYLGYYESDFDWNKETLDESSHLKRHKLNRYHSQTYVNGTACDVINHNRDTEIRFVCDDSSSETYIDRVDEPSTCSYVITVHTPYICSHPHTRPQRPAKPVDIVCRPILNPVDYEKYEEMKVAELEEKKARLRSQLQHAQHIYRKVLHSPFRTGNEQEEEDLNADSDDGLELEEEGEYADIERQFFSEVANFLDLILPAKGKEDLTDVPKKKLSGKKETKQDEESLEAIRMIERFIVQERLQNMEPFRQSLLVRNVADMLRLNKDLPTADLARLVEKYVSKFVETAEDIGEIEKHMEGVEEKVGKSIRNQFVEDVKNLAALPIEQNSDEKENENERKNSPVSVTVKVHKFKSLEDVDDFNAADLEQPGEDAADIDPTWKKLEEDIGKGLEEAGFETESNHIEIRLITNNENIAGGLSMTTEEGIRFREMLLEVVAGGAARKREAKKQKSLHNNYNLVWKKGGAEFSSMSNFDEEPEDTEIKSPIL